MPLTAKVVAAAVRDVRSRRSGERFVFRVVLGASVGTSGSRVAELRLSTDTAADRSEWLAAIDASGALTAR